MAYKEGARLIRRNATGQFERAGERLDEELEEDFKRVNETLDALSRSTSRYPSIGERMDRLAFYQALLAEDTLIQSLIHGYEDGSYLLITRNGQGLDAITRRPVRQGGFQAIRATYDADLNLVQSAPDPRYLSFVPQDRPWYQDSLGSGQAAVTSQYISHSTGLPGYTFSKRVSESGPVVGIDIPVSSLTDALADSLGRGVGGAQSDMALVTDEGLVVATAETTSPPALPEAEVRLPPLKEHENQSLRAAGRSGILEDPQNDGRYQSFRHDGISYAAGFIRVGVGLGRNLFVVGVIEEWRLLSEARALALRVLLSTGGVLIVVSGLVIVVSRRITRKLRALAESAEALRGFDFSETPEVHSSVLEVDQLGDTVTLLRTTIQKFITINHSLHVSVDVGTVVSDIAEEIRTVSHAERCRILIFNDTTGAYEPSASATAAAAEHAEASGASLSPSDVERLQRQGTLVAGASCGQSGGPDGGDGPWVMVPLADRSGEPMGLLLLRYDQLPQEATLGFVVALSATAALSLETGWLLRQQKEVFEALIQLIATAIDTKSPYTARHCAKVPEITLALARQANESDAPPFQSFALGPKDWEALYLAAWLHDCGKVTTPEYVVDKATKLETIHNRIHEVRMRFELLKSQAEVDYWRGVAGGESVDALRQTLADRLKQLDDDFAFVATCNIGGEAMSDADADRLTAIAATPWVRTLDDRLGMSREELSRVEGIAPAPLPTVEPLLADRPEHRIERPSDPTRDAHLAALGVTLKAPHYLYDRGELHNLSIRRGTLTDEERYKINEHIIESIRMIDSLPLPKHLKSARDIAGGHHERLDGKGYPMGLSAEELSIPARIMAIADVFEALTASDRPYKPPKTLEQVLAIMTSMAKGHHLDPDLLQLFVESGLAARFASEANAGRTETAGPA
ncbi:HD domain-containing phosphohydrolase [Synechococcus sp. RSCCF101]|uniref:HD domain-containing phosphohydrolase n=1 Tax=Synechococcus sp. RSCCF101 TaxID=2511069 RepID=UPI00177B4B33|nr:HD domain-containing phosphohydrolase [Synechococcus sp. RSCCF101]